MTTRSTRNSLPSLWEQAAQLWTDLVNGFGNSALIMRWGRMRALEHRALGQWLRNLEQIVRRAIRADAEDVDLPPLRPRTPHMPRAKRPPPEPNEGAQSLRTADPDLPATWKTCFRMHPPPSGKQRARKRSEPREQRPCRGYALRIEALRRVLCYRDEYVLRYARRLARTKATNLRALAEALADRDPSLQPNSDAPDPAPEPTPRNPKHVEPG